MRSRSLRSVASSLVFVLSLSVSLPVTAALRGREKEPPRLLRLLKLLFSPSSSGDAAIPPRP